MALESHHLAWLSAHSDRTAEWLSDRLRDGFDVHHLDGDHGNNDPGNLVLIEAADHMRLHGLTGFIVRRLAGGPGRKPGKISQSGLTCYEHRRSGLTWHQAGEKAGISGSSALVAARGYARASGNRWPIIPRQEW